MLSNQQVLSGRMMTAMNWERYPNYPLLLLGCFVLVGWRQRALRRTGLRVLTPAVAVAILAVCDLTWAQRRVFQAFRAVNERSAAMKLGLERAGGADPRRTRLVLDEPGLAPLLQFRMEEKLDCQVDYNRAIGRVARLSEPNGNWGLRSSFKERLYGQFVRTGRSPGEVSRILAEEAEQGAGFFLSFLFSLRDCWYPMTDDRLVRREVIRTMLPAIVRDYSDTLLSGRGTSEPAIRLTGKGPEGRFPPLGIHERLLASATVGSETVHAILQTSGSVRGAPQ